MCGWYLVDEGRFTEQTLLFSLEINKYAVKDMDCLRRHEVMWSRQLNVVVENWVLADLFTITRMYFSFSE